jgi:hypothetical protein
VDILLVFEILTTVGHIIIGVIHIVHMQQHHMLDISPRGDFLDDTFA